MAAMVDIEDFLPWVMTRAPSAPLPEAYAAIREAARTVCRRLKLWRGEDTLTVAEPNFEAIYSPPEARVHLIETAMMDGTILKSRDIDQLDREHPGWRLSEPGTARIITQTEPGHITVFPRQAGTVSISVLLIPSLDAETLPEFLLRDYADLVGTGAAGMMLASVPNPEFLNPNLGSGLLAKFSADLDRLNAGSARHQIRAPLRSRSSFF